MHIYGNKGHNSLHVELLLVPSLEVPLGLHVGSPRSFVVVLNLVSYNPNFELNTSSFQFDT